MTKRLISLFLTLVLLVVIPVSARYRYNPYTTKLDYYEAAEDIDLGDIGDLTLTGLATGNILYYNGTAWVNLATGANAEVLTLAAGIPSWAAGGAPALHAPTHLAAGADPVDHDQLLNYVAGQHLVLPNTIAAVLNDHDLAAHTALGLYDAPGDVDHNLTTNYVAAQHTDHTVVSILSAGLITGGGTIDGNQTLTLTEATIEAAIDTLGAVQFTGDVEFLEDIDVTWGDAADRMRIIQGNAAGIAGQALIFINDDRTGATANEPDEATIHMTGEGPDSWAIYADIGKVQFDGDFILDWGSDVDNASITQTAVAGIATVPLINIDDDRTGVTADTVGEATIVMNAAGTYAFYIQTGQAYFAADTTQIEDVFMDWSDAADHMEINQDSATGIEDQALVLIIDERTGATANEALEASLRITADGPAFAFYVQEGSAQFDGNAYFTEDVEMVWSDAADIMNIYQASATQTEDVALVTITSEAEGATVDEPSEALLKLNTEQPISWALYAQSGIVEYGDNVYWNWAGATDHAVITQAAVAGTEDQPLIFIDDDRTGVTANEKGEATIVIDAEGTYSMYFIDGGIYMEGAAVFESASDVITTNKFWAKDNAWIAWGTAIDWQTNWDENAAGDDLLVHIFMGSGTTALWYSLLNPSGMTDHDDYQSPTFVLTNDEGADANDYAGVVIGERGQADVAVAHYFDLYAMTGSADGTPDATTTELAAIFRFGPNGTGVPGSATTPGDVLFEGAIEVDGEAYFDESIKIGKLAYFSGEYDEGAEGGAFTIDWTNGQKQKVTITGVNLDMSFTDPPGPCNLMLKIVQGDGDDTIDWTHDTKIGAAGGTAPTLSTGNGDEDIFAFYFDGTNYWLSALLDVDLIT